MKNKIKTVLVLIFCALTTHYVLLTTHSAHAQQVNLSLDPPIVSAKIRPGKSIIVAYTVENTGDPTNLQFLIRPFTPQGQFGSLSVLPHLEGPVQFNLENADIQLEKPFFFPSRQKKQAVVRIKIPVGIPDGDYYYLILAETVPAFSVAGQSTGVASASIGSPLLITITDSGVTEIKATVAEFSFKPDYEFTIGNNTVRIVDNAKQLPIMCSVRNMGKHLVQPHGTITDQIGGVKKKYEIIPQNILSNAQRMLKVYSDNQGTPQTTLLLSHLPIGTHRIGLELSFGENTPIQYKTLTFLALPLRFMKVVFILLMIVIVAFVLRSRQKKK